MSSRSDKILGVCHDRATIKTTIPIVTQIVIVETKNKAHNVAAVL